MPDDDEAANEVSETSEPAETEPNTSDLSDDNTDTDADADASTTEPKVDEQMAFLDEGMNVVDGLDNDSLEVGAENADAVQGDKSASDAATAAATPAVVSPDADADDKSAAEAKPVAGEKAPEATKPEAKPDETKAAPAVSEEPAKVEPAKPEVKAAPAEVKPATPEAGPKPSPEPSQETPPETQMTQEQAQTYLAEMRGAAIGQLEQRYALSDEEVELLRDSPELALPKFGAALFFDAVTQAINAVQAQLPAAIASYMQSSQVETSAEDAFYQTWPDLKDQDPGTVRRIGAAYRAQNPNASAEDFTRDVGASAMVALRVPFTGATAPNGSATQTQTQVQVQAPVVVPTPAVKAFTPALGGGSAPASGPPAAENLITEADRQMFEETDELDAD